MNGNITVGSLLLLWFGLSVYLIAGILALGSLYNCYEDITSEHPPSGPCMLIQMLLWPVFAAYLGVILGWRLLCRR